MPKAVEMTISGDKRVQHMFDSLEFRLQKRALDPGMKEAAKTILLQIVRRYVPKDTGLLSSLLAVRRAKGSDGKSQKHAFGWAVVVRGGVGDTGKKPRRVIAKFLERGTKHIKARWFMWRATKDARHRVIEYVRRRVAQEVMRVKA